MCFNNRRSHSVNQETFTKSTSRQFLLLTSLTHVALMTINCVTWTRAQLLNMWQFTVRLVSDWQLAEPAYNATSPRSCRNCHCAEWHIYLLLVQTFIRENITSHVKNYVLLVLTFIRENITSRVKNYVICVCLSVYVLYSLIHILCLHRVSTTTLGQFQSGVKTILFRLAYGTWLGAFVTV